MNTRTVLTFSALLVSLACGPFSSVTAAKYFRPDESKELFKLEKIPLQVDSMKELSKHLTVIAMREQDDSAVQRRGTGQLLAVAMRLDPANQEARETNRAMIRNVATVSAPEDKILKAKARLRFYQRWLASPDAGSDANALAKYITDASRVLKSATINNADSADWSGVIPPLDRYENDGKKEKMPKPDRADDPDTNDTSAPKKKETPDSSPGYQIAELSIKMPLAMETATKYRDPKQNFAERTRYTTSYETCAVAVTISPKNDGVSLKVKSKLGRGNGHEDAGGISKPLKAMEKSMNNASSSAGANVTIKISSSKSYSAQNGSAPLAAIRLMLKASRENKELRNDIHLCADLDSTGKLCLPSNFWRVLDALRKDDGKRGRLIVPSTAAVPLTQLLVFGEPDFFTRWEVFTVATMDEALAVATKVVGSDLSKATELYMPVRKLSGKSDVTKLAVNRAVRKRLSEVARLCPNHLSAKVLLLQGSGHRPMRLSQVGLAYHIQPIVKRMNHVLTKNVNPDRPSSSMLKNLHVMARAELDPIERLVSRTDGELYEEALKLANDLRSLNLLIKRNARDDHNNTSAQSKVKAMIFSLQGSAAELEAKVNKVIIDAAEK